MTKVFGLMVIKNEKDRYLSKCLEWMVPFFDDIFIYDDISTDGSVDVARSFGCKLSIRQESDPSFIDHEGRFRQNAWSKFEEVIKPELGDWILAFDADEFLVSGDPHTSIRSLIKSAKDKSASGIIISFKEIFSITDQGDYMVRVDGLWSSVRGPRLFEYKHNAKWSNKAMGCGSEPSYVSQGKLISAPEDFCMLHFGYAKDSDVQEKYERYSSLVYHGHSNSHIESIIKTPTLVKWEGHRPIGI